MNEIKLSGILRGIVEHAHDGDVEGFLTASLLYNRDGESILVVAAGASVLQLARFFDGDAALVAGRLTTFRGGFAVMVDSVRPWSIAPLRCARYFDSSNGRSAQARPRLRSESNTGLEKPTE